MRRTRPVVRPAGLPMRSWRCLLIRVSRRKVWPRALGFCRLRRSRACRVIRRILAAHPLLFELNTPQPKQRTKQMKTMMFAAAAALMAIPALAHEYTLGDLVIDHPMAFETAAGVGAGGGYVTITNEGDTPDRLVAVRGDFPRVEVHEVVEVDDVMRMQELEEGLEIPAGATVNLEPGGYHVMFMGLSEPFEVGDEIPVTLVFEQAGEIEVMFNVEARGGEAMETDHGEHGH